MLKIAFRRPYTRNQKFFGRHAPKPPYPARTFGARFVPPPSQFLLPSDATDTSDEQDWGVFYL